MCAHAEFTSFGRTEGIGCVPMQNLLLLAELKALGVCPCRRTAGIGRVPMRNVFLLAELKALGVCLSTRQELPSEPWGPCGTARAMRFWTESEQGGERVRALRDRALHLLRYCAALAGAGPQATAPKGAGPGI